MPIVLPGSPSPCPLEPGYKVNSHYIVHTYTLSFPSLGDLTSHSLFNSKVQGFTENFSNRVLTDSDRKDVVCTLATMLMTYVPKPSQKQCRIVARRHTEEHNFLKDEDGDVS